jgi:peptidoglycan-associated lipoprotein
VAEVSPARARDRRGYADPTGSHELNMVLSRERADAARDYLVAQGISAARLEVVAYGDTRLKYAADDSRNRRVAIEARR